jgi:hypothetical protein
MVHNRENTARNNGFSDQSVFDDSIVFARQTGGSHAIENYSKVLSAKDIQESLLESIPHPSSHSLRVGMVASTQHLPPRPRSEVSNKVIIRFIFRHNDSCRAVAINAVMKIPSIGTPPGSICAGVHRVSSSRTVMVVHPRRDSSDVFSSTTSDVTVFIA